MIKKIRNKINGDIHLSELLKGSVVAFVLRILGMILGFVLTYFISQKFGAEGVGTMNIFNQLIIVLSLLLSFGLNNSVLRFVGQFNNELDRNKLHQLYTYIIKIVGASSIIAGVFLFLFADNINTFLDGNSNYTLIIRLVAITLPFFSINQIIIEFIRGMKILHISELIRTVTLPLMMVVFLLFFWNSSWPITIIIYSFIGGTIINFIFSNSTIITQLKKIKKVSDSSFSIKKLLSTSYPMMITGVSFALMTALPIFFLDFFVSTKDVGIFSIAFRISTLISIVLVVVNSIAAPKFAEIYWSKRRHELQKFISQTSKIMFWAALVFSLIVIFSSKEILLFFGEEYLEGKLSVLILVIGQLFNASMGSVGLLLNMSGNEKVFRNIILCTTTITIFLCVFLIPTYGFIGAALAVTINEFIWNSISSYYVKKKMNIISFYLPFKRH